jgi:hypothetical protein
MPVHKALRQREDPHGDAVHEDCAFRKVPRAWTSKPRFCLTLPAHYTSVHILRQNSEEPEVLRRVPVEAGVLEETTRFQLGSSASSTARSRETTSPFFILYNPCTNAHHESVGTQG